MLIYRTGWFFFAAGVWITSAHAREVQLITFNEMTDDTREYLDRPRFLKAVYQLQPNQNEPSAISIKRKRRVMNSASRTKSFHYFCAPSKYAPAWWLKPDVELRRAAHYDAVVSIACEFGIPTSLLDAAVAQESGYNSRPGRSHSRRHAHDQSRVRGICDHEDHLPTRSNRLLPGNLDQFRLHGNPLLCLRRYRGATDDMVVVYDEA